MAESMASLPPIEPGEQGNADGARRWRFQFSLSTLLLFTVIVALVMASLVMYRRMKRAEEELDKVRDIAGYLKVEDENLFYAVAIQTGEPWTWRWRVFLPAGHKYSWHTESGEIPVAGMPHGNGASSYNSLPLINGTEAIVYMTLRKGLDGRWLLTLSCQATNMKDRQTVSVSDEIVDQILTANMTEEQCLGDVKAVSCKLDQPVVFLKHRIGEKQPGGSWRTSQNPTPGIMVWLEAAP